MTNDVVYHPTRHAAEAAAYLLETVRDELQAIGGQDVGLKHERGLEQRLVSAWIGSRVWTGSEREVKVDQLERLARAVIASARFA